MDVQSKSLALYRWLEIHISGILPTINISQGLKLPEKTSSMEHRKTSFREINKAALKASHQISESKFSPSGRYIHFCQGLVGESFRRLLLHKG